MYYTYVLYSLKDKMFYTGYTSNIEQRINAHNKGEVYSTKNRRPLKLVYYEVCLNQQDATHREKYLKSTYGKRYIKNRLKNYLLYDKTITQGKLILEKADYSIRESSTNIIFKSNYYLRPSATSADKPRCASNHRPQGNDQ